MFGLKLVTQREILLWQATTLDYKAECERLRLEIDRERRRADGAINALLTRRAGVALVPQNTKPEDPEEIERRMNDLFGDATEDDGASVIAQVQGVPE